MLLAVPFFFFFFSFPKDNLFRVCLNSLSVDLLHYYLELLNVLNLVQLKSFGLFYTAFLLSSGNTGYIKKQILLRGRSSSSGLVLDY